ncbi:MAG TPA: type II toxin-antitoxin system MqsA family antitoxin [Anaerolineae bacterium]|nr:type II toxin-antitoxin system MqsA family antitoxin [Anaerolineae bacterium]
MGEQLQDTQEKRVNPADRCDLCGGELRPGKTTLEIWRGEELIVIRDVPADVCQQCGEAYISAAVSKRLDRFLEEYHRHRPERYIAVPQYSATQAIGG